MSEKISTIDKLISISKAYTQWSNKAFDIAEINHLLADSYEPDDFNAFKVPLTNKTDFNNAVAAAIAARDNPKAPWLMWTCSCGNPITLSHNEVLWRRQAGIDFPCMCDQCISKALGRS